MDQKNKLKLVQGYDGELEKCINVNALDKKENNNEHAKKKRKKIERSGK